MNVTAAGLLTMVTDSADFCRYTRGRMGMWLGTLIGKVGGGCFAALLGVYAAAATLGKTANVFEIVSGLSTGWFALLMFLIVIALDNWTSTSSTSTPAPSRFRTCSSGSAGSGRP
jgi:purine-cytosine permease-like protein